MGIKNWVDLAFRRMTLLPFQGLLTCLRPLFLPSGCWVWRFCWPGSLCTLATLLRASAVLVCPGASTQDHCLVGVSQNHLQETGTSKIPLSLKEGWERIPGMGVFKSLGGKTRPCSPKLPKLRFCFQSLMPDLSFSKTSHPWFGSHQKA